MDAPRRHSGGSDDREGAAALRTRAAGLLAEGRTLDALRVYDRIIDRGWADAAVFYETGNALTRLGEYAQAARAYRDSLVRDAGRPEVHHNLGVVLYRLGDVDTALGHLRRALRSDRAAEVRAGIATILPGCPSATPGSIVRARRRLGRQLTRAAAARPLPPRPAGPTVTGRPLRVGYLSSFFDRDNYMMPVWALLNHHDRRRVEVHLLSDVPADKVAGGYRPVPGDCVHDVRDLDNDRLAAAIRDAWQLDILVDLNGYSVPERLGLFACRPAPLTVAWFNMYATSGLPGVDLLVGDEVVVRPGEEAAYTERVVRLPVSYLTFEVNHPVPPVAPAPCRVNGFLTFGCLCTQYKITPPAIEAWARILAQAPSARLLIANRALGSRCNREDHLRPRFAALGIGADRIELRGPEEHDRFLRLYDRVDVALDTFPYSGGTTTMEALWQGVPVLTVNGDRWAARTSASLLHYGGLDGYVALGVDAYVARAVDLATAPAGWADLARQRATLRECLAASPVCDGTALAREMERLYLTEAARHGHPRASPL